MSVKSFLAVALCASVVGLSLPGAADAGQRHRGRHYNHHNYNNYGGAAAIGLGVGVILGSAFAPRYYAPRYYYGPPPVRYDYGLRPWTGEWYNYCSSKYRSFNPRTGYFLGYDGDYHFCR